MRSIGPNEIITAWASLFIRRPGLGGIQEPSERASAGTSSGRSSQILLTRVLVHRSLRIVERLQGLSSSDFLALSQPMRRYGVDVNTVGSSLKNIGTLVPPAAAILNDLGRVIHTRNDATHLNFIHNVPQRCGREVFTGSEPTSILFYRACKFTSLARGT